jgi:hypothetical protein
MKLLTLTTGTKKIKAWQVDSVPENSRYLDQCYLTTDSNRLFEVYEVLVTYPDGETDTELQAVEIDFNNIEIEEVEE